DVIDHLRDVAHFAADLKQEPYFAFDVLLRAECVGIGEHVQWRGECLSVDRQLYGVFPRHRGRGSVKVSPAYNWTETRLWNFHPRLARRAGAQLHGRGRIVS